MTTALTVGRRALEHAAPRSYWTDRADAPTPSETLSIELSADLAIVGGGFTGLWSAWRALDRNPNLDVVVVEAKHIGYGASGRNGGFVSSSLTHGLAHGKALWPQELDALQQEGRTNLAELVAQVREAGIDCDLQPSGKTTIAVQPWQVAALEDAAELAQKYGEKPELLSREQMQADVHSDTFLGGLRDRDGTVMVDPARLAWGMSAHLRSRGLRIIENTAVTGMQKWAAAVISDSGFDGFSYAAKAGCW